MDKLDNTTEELTTAAEAPVSDEIAATRRDIEQTRANMGETLEAIREKLNPQMLMDHAKDTVMEVTSSVADKAKDTVHTIVSDVSEHAKEAASGAVSGAVGEVKDAVGTVIDTTKKAGSTVMDTVMNNKISTLVLLGAGWYLLNGRKAAVKQHSYPGDYDYAGRPEPASTLDSLLEVAKRNPIPAALVVGTAVHLMNNHSHTESAAATHGPGARSVVDTAGERISDTLHQAGDRAADVVHDAKGTISSAASTVKDALGSAASTVKDSAGNAATAVKETASRAGDAASNLASTVGEKAKNVSSNLADAMQANPLTVGAWALGIGATIALLLPDTEPENRLMGKTRDTLLNTAQQSAGQVLDKVHHVSVQALDSVSEKAKENLAPAATPATI